MTIHPAPWHNVICERPLRQKIVLKLLYTIKRLTESKIIFLRGVLTHAFVHVNDRIFFFRFTMDCGYLFHS